jgi:hypothetical protein
MERSSWEFTRRGLGTMDITKVNDKRTKEIRARRISLARLEGGPDKLSDPIGGWEYSPPEVGERYLVYLGKGRLLRTSPVQRIRESGGFTWIETLNSVYRIQYLAPTEENE